MLKIIKKCVKKVLIFVKFWKCSKKIIKSANYFCYFFILYKRRYSQIEPYLKVEKEEGCEASLKPSIIKILKMLFPFWKRVFWFIEQDKFRPLFRDLFYSNEIKKSKFGSVNNRLIINKSIDYHLINHLINH